MASIQYCLAIVVLGFLALMNDADGRTYDDAAMPCFVAFNNATRGPGSQLYRAPRVDDFIRAFETGVDQSCQTLNTLMSCVESNTVGLDTSANASSKGRYDKMKEMTQFVCETKIAEFRANQACITGTEMKAGLTICQGTLDNATSPIQCSTLESVLDCTDKLTRAKCPTAETSFGHLMRVYLVARLNLSNCNIAHTDYHSDGKNGGATAWRGMGGQSTVIAALASFLVVRLFPFTP